jgi:tetratricopeptide (TPR) repeat protein
MQKYLTLFLSVLLIPISIKAQDKSDYRQKFTEGNLLVLEENYVQALKNYLWAYNIDSTNSNINYKIGLCYLKTETEKSKALNYLEKAVVETTKKYDNIEPTEKSAPITAFYYYGQALHLNYKFDEAIASYEKFKSFLTDNPGDWMNMVNRQIEVCNNAKILVAAPIRVNIDNLGDSINTPFPEYSPVLSADEKTLIFTSRRPGSTGGDKTMEDQFYEDIYIAYRKPDSTWTKPVSISPNINTITHEASVGLTADAQTLLIYKDINGGDIYFSSLDNNDQWSTPEPVGSNVNTPSWETSACLTPDGNTLYFVSNRKGGLGGRDIWKCVKLPNGKWSLAVNLGAPINTAYDEESPFIHPSGNLLFFSSNGHNTIGGFDIFFSNLGDKGWEEPLNIGYPINTTEDDVFYVTSPDGRRGYYSSASRAEGYGEKDIYMISIPTRIEEPLVLIKGSIKPKIGEALSPNLEIIATNNESGAVVGIYRPLMRDGSFTIIIPPGSNYTLSYQNNGKEFYSESIEVPAGAAYQEIDKAVTLKDVSMELPIGTDTAEVNSTAAIKGDPNDKNLVLDVKKEQIKTEKAQAEKKETGKPRESLAKVNHLNFEMHFAYNVTETDVTDKAFKEFVANIMERYKQKGTISITIESSASRVPTKTAGGNKELSQIRNNKIRDQLKKALSENGVSENKIVVTKVKTVVDGPAYKNDYIANRAEYEKYQYIKVTAK